MCIGILAAPWPVPAGQTERLEAEAQICDTRWDSGRQHLLGARHAATVWEEHPPAAHCSQFRLFGPRSSSQMAQERRKKGNKC